jgi:hypothetical protein
MKVSMRDEIRKNVDASDNSKLMCYYCKAQSEVLLIHYAILNQSVDNTQYKFKVLIHYIIQNRSVDAS